MLKGRCLCGAVTFKIEGAINPPVACHCSQCRRQSGHVWACTDVKREALAIDGAEKLTWFQSSETGRRGFCSICGSVLFCDLAQEDAIDVAMGAIDPPTGTMLARHVYVADKGDYYEIADGLPQKERGSG